MDPLTHEELDDHEKYYTGRLNDFVTSPISTEVALRLIAAARASIPRPIADAPRDGTEVIIHDDYDRFQNATFAHGFWFSKVTGEIIHDPIAFIPIPKGGAS